MDSNKLHFLSYMNLKLHYANFGNEASGSIKLEINPLMNVFITQVFVSVDT